MLKNFFIYLSLFVALSALGSASASETEKITVKPKRAESFSYTMRLVDAKPFYFVYELKYPTPVKNSIPTQETVFAKYFLPKSAKKPSSELPAVVCLHILGGRQELTSLICVYLAAHGVPALMPYMPSYGPRNVNGLKQRMKNARDAAFQYLACIDQGTAEISRAYDILASRPEIDSAKINLEGISLGAILASIAGGKDDRFHKLVILLGGGDFNKMIGNSRETRWLRSNIDSLPAGEREKLDAYIKKLDPLTFAPKLTGKAERNEIMMVNAANDEVIPRVCTLELAKAMNMSDKVEWLEGVGHYTAIAELPRILDRITNFVSDDHPPRKEVKLEGRGAGGKPLRQLFIQLIADLIGGETTPHRSRIVDMKISFGKHRGRAKIITGSAGRFIFTVNAPKVGSATAGHCSYPWLRTQKGVIFEGVLNPVADATLVKYLNSDVKGYFTALKGLLQMLLIMPQALDKYVKCEESNNEDGTFTLKIQSKKKSADSVEIVFNAAKDALLKISFSVNKREGTIQFVKWNMNAFSTEELFMPPEEKKMVEVDQKQMEKLLASFVNFAGDFIR